MKNRRTADHFKGCLLGGAAGDALGAPIEFMTLERIRSKYGAEGLTDYEFAYGRLGAITDDTQMTLFTAEGLILSKVRPEYSQSGGIVAALYHAYLRWLYTQEPHIQGQLIKGFGTCSIVDGILTGHKGLFAQRAPGNSCLSALESGNMGTMKKPINDSKGCGGVMRVAPVGLLANDAEQAFQIGCESAAITHGHPTGYLSSGVLAAVIALIMEGHRLTDAIESALQLLVKKKNHGECFKAVEQALLCSYSEIPGPEIIERIGGGWVAEEALAIGFYCALAAGNDIKKGLTLAVNHSGDSDSTGSITGNIMGAIYGVDAIPEQWLNMLELKDLIEETAVDLFDRFLK